MAIEDAAGAKVTRDAELALFADFGMSAGELSGVAGIVELAGFFEARKDSLAACTSIPVYPESLPVPA